MVMRKVSERKSQGGKRARQRRQEIAITAAGEWMLDCMLAGGCVTDEAMGGEASALEVCSDAAKGAWRCICDKGAR